MTITSELIETFGGNATTNATALSVGSTMFVGAIVGILTTVTALILLPTRAAISAATSKT